MSTALAEHEWFMRLAMNEAAMCTAAGGRPFGAVVVRDGIVIGRSGARRDSSKNPTGHAEILAIQEAAAYLGHADMSGCTMYTNRGSCAMCCGVMISNNLSTVVTGINPAEEGEEDVLDQLIALLNRNEQTAVIRGVLFDETLRHFQAEQARMSSQPQR